MEGEGGKDFTSLGSKGSVLLWCLWHGLLTEEALGTFGTLRMENNQTGSPMVSPARLRVAIMGGPTFPKHGKLQGSTWKGTSWLELSGISAMNSNQMYEANQGHKIEKSNSYSNLMARSKHVNRWDQKSSRCSQVYQIVANCYISFRSNNNTHPNLSGH